MSGQVRLMTEEQKRKYARYGTRFVEYRDGGMVDVPIAPIKNRRPKTRLSACETCTVDCPICGREHGHGADEGTRAPHCAPKPPGAPGDYYVANYIEPAAQKEEAAAPTRATASDSVTASSTRNQ